MASAWIVLLEAAGELSAPPMTPATLRALMEAMASEDIVGVFDPYRYAIQLRVSSSSPAEALFTATARWAEAVRQVGAQRWALERIELVSPREFERDRARADRRFGPEPPPGFVSEGADLLRDVFYDSLTSFPTLALFRDRAQNIISSSALSGRGLALLLVDIDGLGTVNRELGYVYGDQVLAELAGRVALMVDATRVVARLAGDEFLLLADNDDDSAETLATQLLAAIRAPVTVKGQQVELTASVGLAAVFFNSDIDECLGRAGTAMCVAKEGGGDRLRWWEEGLSGDPVRLDFLAHGVPGRLAHVLLLERAALAANECASMQEASTIVMHQVLADTGWRAGHLWLADETRSALEPTGAWKVTGPNSLNGLRQQTASRTLARGEGLPGRVLDSGRPEWKPLAAEQVADGHEKAAIEAGFSAAVAFPVMAGAEVVAVLEFFSARTIAPDESFLEVMAAVGAQLGRISERERAALAVARSEARYRIMADSLPELIWSAHPDGSCEWVNRRWLEFTGRCFRDETGDSWVAGVHPDDRERCVEGFRQAFASCRPFELEYRLLRADGEYRWLLDRGSPVYENSVVTGYVGSCVDVTDQRHAEAVLRDEEARFRVLVERAEVMIAVIGADGRMIEEFVPPGHLGYPRGDRPHGSEQMHPDDLPRAVAAYRYALDHPGAGSPFECRVRHFDGSWRWMRVVATNMLDHPLVRGIVYTGADISDRVALLERLRALEEGREHDYLNGKVTAAAYLPSEAATPSP